MDVIFSIIAMLGIGGGFLYALYWTMQKYFGVTPYTNSTAQDVVNVQKYAQAKIIEYEINKPNLVQEAIKECKRKGYKTTHKNVLDEIEKLEKRPKDISKKKHAREELAVAYLKERFRLEDEIPLHINEEERKQLKKEIEDYLYKKYGYRLN